MPDLDPASDQNQQRIDEALTDYPELLQLDREDIAERLDSGFYLEG